MDKPLFSFKRDNCQTCICKTCEYKCNKQCGNCFTCKNYGNHWVMCSLYFKKLPRNY